MTKMEEMCQKNATIGAAVKTLENSRPKEVRIELSDPSCGTSVRVVFRAFSAAGGETFIPQIIVYSNGASAPLRPCEAIKLAEAINEMLTEQKEAGK